MACMSTAEISEIKSASSEETELLGEKFGSLLQGGEVIELAGDLGAGKTTFVRGVARGLDSKDDVSSPTFTLRNVYQGRLSLHHFDLYRIHNDPLITHEIEEVVEDERSVAILEWAQNVPGVLGSNHIVITFQPLNENERLIHISLPPKRRYLKL